MTSILDYYPSYNDKWFQYKLTRKLELIKVWNSEDKYAFQAVLSLLLHSDTPYGEHLLAISAGVGKSRCIIYLMSLYFKFIRRTGSFKDDNGNHTIGNNMKPIFMAENGNTIENLKDQLRQTYPNLFRSKKYNNISSIRRENTKGVKQYVELLKYDTFSKQLSTMTDEDVIQTYDGRLIIADEAHYIRVKEKMNGSDYKTTYKQISRFLRLVRGKKVLVTATPAYADVSHFTSLFNLIIPKDMVPMDPNKISALEGNELVEYLAPYVTGRISLMKQTYMPKKVSDIGTPISYYVNKDKSISRTEGDYKRDTFISIISVKMSEFQQKVYTDVLQMNSSGLNNPAQRSLELDLRCISNWVFPDGNYGKASFSSNKDTSIFLDEDEVADDMKTWVLYNKISKRYEFTVDMKKHLKANGMAYYSPKYYKVCKGVLKNYKMKLPGFTFSFFYEPGVVILGLLIEWLSYQWYNSYCKLDTVLTEDEYINSEVMISPFIIYNGKMTADQIIAEGPKPRITIVPQTQANAVVSNIKELFNHHLNRDGSYLSNIIGSEKISTSTNLSNGIVFKCTGSVWTPGEYTQASDRIVRSDSQTWKPLEDRKVYIHNYASTFRPAKNLPNFSVEEKMYIKCNEKYIVIEKLMDSVDRFNVCGPLFRKRNEVPDDYIFYGYDKVLERIKGKLVWIDRDFDLPYDNSSYYASVKPHKKLLSDSIIFILKERSVVTIDELYKLLSKDEAGNEEDILYSVQNLIRDNVKVTDAYGSIRYIRNDNDKLYLASSVSTNSSLDIYYADNLYIKNNKQVYDEDVIDNAEVILNMIDTTDITNDSLDMLKFHITNSTADIQSYLLESSILGTYGDKGIVIKEILNYRFYVLENEGKMTVIHTIYHTSKSKGTTNRNMKQLVSKGLLRIYTERDICSNWRFCTKAEDSIYIGKINDNTFLSIDEAIEKSNKLFGVKIIGIINTADYIFKIYDRSAECIRMKKNRSEVDHRTYSTGCQRSKWSQTDILLYLHTFNVKPPIDNVDYSKIKKKAMIDTIKSNRIKDIPSNNDLLYYFYNFSLAKRTSRNYLCDLLQSRLEELDLVVYI